MAQSGFDKIFNWEGELDFISEKFAKTPLSNFSAFGLIQVTIFESWADSKPILKTLWF